MVVDLSNADLGGADLRGADLNRADLSGAHISGADLSGANLVGADLSVAKLRAANLGGTGLIWADLREADLCEAHLRGAHLRGADLSGADLSEADLSEADLSGANLSGANLSGADLSGADLRGADLSDANVTYARWDRSRMRGNYLGIRGLGSCFGNALFKRAAADQDFLDTLGAHWRHNWRIRLFQMWGWLDYGRSMWRVAAFGLGIVSLFAAVFYLWPALLCYKESANTWFTPYYYSIVTFTTLGFGDVRPSGAMGEILASIEVIMGYVSPIPSFRLRQNPAE